MKKLVITVVAVLAMVALTASVYAVGPGCGRGHGGGQHCYGGGSCGGEIGAVSGMNLTAEQTEKIEALRIAHMTDIKPIQDQMFSKRGDLKLLWLKKNPDQKKIAEINKEIRALRDQMIDKMTAHRLEMTNILTPEQQKLLKAHKPGRCFGPQMKGAKGMKGGAGCQGPQGGPQGNRGHHGGGPGMGMEMGMGCN